MSYSTGRAGGARASSTWYPTIAELGMVPVPSTVTVGDIAHALDDDGQPIGDGGSGLDHSFAKLADALEWWAYAGREDRKTPF